MASSYGTSTVSFLRKKNIFWHLQKANLTSPSKKKPGMFTFFYKNKFYKNYEAQNEQSNKNNTEIDNLYIPQVFHSFFFIIFIEQYS